MQDLKESKADGGKEKRAPPPPPPQKVHRSEGPIPFITNILGASEPPPPVPNPISRAANPSLEFSVAKSDFKRSN